MTTPVYAFSADYITSTIADITRHAGCQEPFEKATLDAWRSYAEVATQLGFTFTAEMWLTMLSRAVLPYTDTASGAWLTADEVEENLLADWTRHGLNTEQAWQAMWLV